ncbi:hypothetical protein HYH03_007134 [Edaphochlamys debaryana]|uniref:Pseudouridine synthase RsuA/RluA-like domain-containing protein n=1 Tax=Edaphochlamys debaryana TaxID=47281 RepID=A0A835Y904_9CHLO|nr:hypothetical protein HYH03_007134 [Edaphochlamys debaryana]|eukprot:KAG2494615.1 hypothetical protein HYH03_007134 [Edaphochlamys debaryana]
MHASVHPLRQHHVFGPTPQPPRWIASTEPTSVAPTPAPVPTPAPAPDGSAPRGPGRRRRNSGDPAAAAAAAAARARLAALACAYAPGGPDAATYPYPASCLADALAWPPLEHTASYGAHVCHLVAHRDGPAAEVMAEALGVPQTLCRRLVWFGAAHFCPVTPASPPGRTGHLPEGQLQRMRELREAALAVYGNGSHHQTPRRLASPSAPLSAGGYLRVHAHPRRFPAAHAPPPPLQGAGVERAGAQLGLGAGVGELGAGVEGSGQVPQMVQAEAEARAAPAGREKGAGEARASGQERAAKASEGAEAEAETEKEAGAEGGESYPPHVLAAWRGRVPPTVDNLRESAVAVVEEALSLPPGCLAPAHRLDSGTEGVVVLARGAAFAAAFQALLLDKGGSLRKHYRCVVASPPPPHWGLGRIAQGERRAPPAPAPSSPASPPSVSAGAEAEGDAPGAPSTSDTPTAPCGTPSSESGSAPPPHTLRHLLIEGVRRPGEPAHTVVAPPGASEGTVEAVLRVLGCEEVELCPAAAAAWGRARAWELSVELVTGRTHQVRVQMAAEGLPLLGDRLYSAVAARGWGWGRGAGQGQGEAGEAGEAAGPAAGTAGEGAAGAQGEGEGAGEGEGEGPAALGGAGRAAPSGGSVPRRRREGAEWCREALEGALEPLGLQAHALTLLTDGPMGAAPLTFCAGEPWWRRA